jgi:serine protease AprX
MSVPLPDPEEVRSARAEVRQALGARLEEKASDTYCVAFSRRSRAVGAETLAAVRVPVPAVPTVVEFSDLRPPPPLPRLTERTDWEQMSAAAGALGAASPAGAPMRLRTAVRQKYIEDTRSAGYQVVGEIYQEIERLTGGLLRPPAEVLGDPQIPTAVTQVCWLNQTVRTFAAPEALTEVAAADAVATVDLPRRLLPDADLPNHRCIGLPAFQQRTGLTGRGVIVAVIDGEVALAHPALAGRVVPRRNYTPEPWGNPSMHGTAVAGIIAAADPAVGGIATEATIYNYKVLATTPIGNGDDFSGALAIQQALEDGADIANCSWGAGPAGDGTSREARAVDNAWSLGLAVVKSAGNRGPGPATMTTPADARGVVVVGATDVDGQQVQDYSSRGPANGKPGPSVVAPGGSDAMSLSCCLVGGGFGDAGVGTSYAAPHVSGLLALFLQENPDLIPDQMKERLLVGPNLLPGVAADAQGVGLVRVGPPSP